MKIISFSLYGSKPIYLVGAEKNVSLAKKYYPGWKCRFYVDDSVPTDCINRLKEQGAQIVDMSQSKIGCRKLWRYLVNDDDNVDVWIVRDADSRLNAREKAAVDEWLQSPQKTHIMRDHPYHVADIMAGMFGARGKIVGSMKDLITRISSDGQKVYDQGFLSAHILPLIKDNVMIHDEICHFKAYCVGARSFPTKRHGWHFVGEIVCENDCSHGNKRLMDYYSNSPRKILRRLLSYPLREIKKRSAGEKTIWLIRKVFRDTALQTDTP